MADEPYVFPTAVEGLIRAVGDDLTPALKAQLRALELDLDRPFPPAWRGALFPQWVEACATAVFPAASRDEALRQLGRRFVSSWQATLLGSATAVLMRTIGPKRALTRIERAFRTGDNFTRVEVEHLDDGATRLRFSDAQGMPTYYVGILEGGSVMVGANNSRVELEASEPPSAVLMMRYE
ncbi:MAG: DUF2378 family protein [Archangium sp.]|nr:DUF2378 family protein [Archangium sp.]